jgi:hypothetical protein
VIKIRLVCDSCGGVIADGIDANQLRFQARALYRTREYQDYCLICAAHGREPPWVPQEAPSHAGIDTQAGRRSGRTLKTTACSKTAS